MGLGGSVSVGSFDGLMCLAAIIIRFSRGVAAGLLRALCLMNVCYQGGVPFALCEGGIHLWVSPSIPRREPSY